MPAITSRNNHNNIPDTSHSTAQARRAYDIITSLQCEVFFVMAAGRVKSLVSTEDRHHNCICCKIRLIIVKCITLRLIIVDSTISNRKMRHLRLIIMDSTIINRNIHDY